jgi:hypothetical protein
MPIFKSAMAVLGLSSVMATFSTWSNRGETHATPDGRTPGTRCADCAEEDNRMTVTKKIVVVTGANRGLGLEISRQLARDHGFHVVLTARDPAKVGAGADVAR